MADGFRNFRVFRNFRDFRFNYFDDYKYQITKMFINKYLLKFNSKKCLAKHCSEIILGFQPNIKSQNFTLQ